MNKEYIKIFDDQLAKALAEAGFSYITENACDTNVIYIFERTEEISDAIKRITSDNYSSASSPGIVYDNVLAF